MGALLQMRLLGELTVLKDGEPCALPPSKKARALLCYLATTGRAHRRDRLATLLWEQAADPRASLRWTLTKLRGVVNEGVERIEADRDQVHFIPRESQLDLAAVDEAVSSGLADAELDELRALADTFRGELLEGVELSDHLEFQAWLVAERERIRLQHVAVLTELLTRLSDVDDAASRDEAIDVARRLTRIDPLRETTHATLLRLQLAAGRRREAELTLESARRIFRDLRGGPPREVEGIWRRHGRAAAPSEAAAVAPEPRPVVTRTEPPGVEPMVGRVAERKRLESALQGATAGKFAAVLVVAEAGLGKTRLLEELHRTARDKGATVLEARTYESGEDRAFAPWIDLLEQVDASVRETGGEDLAPLLSSASAPRSTDAELGRTRMFDAVDRVLADVAADAPLVLSIDDAQWLDPASSSLLTFVARRCASRRVLCVLAARGGELHDNEAVVRLLRALRRDRVVDELELGPLSADEIAELTHGVVDAAAHERLARDSAGNPLYALELARAHAADPGREVLPASVRDLIRERVEPLSTAATEVLRWAAVLGAQADLRTLQAVTRSDSEEQLDALEQLQRHALVHLSSSRAGEAGVQFTHELVRRAVYDDLSPPRRSLMHLRVAEVLTEYEDAQGQIAAQVARHAQLAGDSAMAVRACIGAGRRCNRLFAGEEAMGFYRRGRSMVEDLADPVRTRLRIELFEVLVAAHLPKDLAEVAAEIEELGHRALQLGENDHARLAYHLASYLRWDEGRWTDAAQHMVAAARIAQLGSDAERVHAMGEAARCFIFVEQEIAQAQALVLEASALAKDMAHPPGVLADAAGLLALHEGRLDEAEADFERARQLFRLERDHFGEFHALEHSVRVALDRSDLTKARELCAQMVALGERWREGAEGPTARVFSKLVEHIAAGTDASTSAFEDALADLRVAGSKHRLAHALSRAAWTDLERGALDRASRWATEGLDNASIMRRPSEIAIARAVLAEVAHDAGDAEKVAEHCAAIKGLHDAPLPRDVRMRADEVVRKLTKGPHGNGDR